MLGGSVMEACRLFWSSTLMIVKRTMTTLFIFKHHNTSISKLDIMWFPNCWHQYVVNCNEDYCIWCIGICNKEHHEQD